MIKYCSAISTYILYTSHAFILAKNLLKIMLPIGTSICSLTLTKSIYDIGLCSHAFILAKNLLKIMLPIGTSICSLTLTKKVSTTSAYFLLLQVRHIPSLLLRQALYVKLTLFDLLLDSVITSVQSVCTTHMWNFKISNGHNSMLHGSSSW